MKWYWCPAFSPMLLAFAVTWSIAPDANAQTGILTINGNYTQTAGAINIRLGGTSRGTQYDALVVTGAINISGGDLNVSLIDDFEPVDGNMFDILDFASFTGAFDDINLPVGYQWNTSQIATTGILSIGLPPGLPGDFNGDNVVDAADYTVWRDNLNGNESAFAPGSGSGNGTIGSEDYDLWRSSFGSSLGAGSLVGSGNAIPEPTSIGLLLAGGLALVVLRRVK